MVSEQNSVRVVRRALEGFLDADVASGVLFEALDRHGPNIPETTDELVEFVRGSLRAALDRCMTPESAASRLDEVVELLYVNAAEQAEEEVVLVVEEEPPRRRKRDATAAIPIDSQPVFVLAVAASEAFATRLLNVLGPEWVAPRSVSAAEELRRVTEHLQPALVIVDATDFSSIEPLDIAKAMEALPPTTVRAVWAAELPYARAVLDALAETDPPPIALRRSDGVEPFFDLIRSRRAAS